MSARSERGSAVYEAALRGDFSGLGKLDHSADLSGWSVATKALLWTAKPSALSAPVQAELAALQDTAKPAASLACLEVIRGAVVGWQDAPLESWVALQKELVGGAQERFVLALRLSQAWIQLRGEVSATLQQELADVENAARSTGAAEILLEATSMQAWVALCRRDMETATRTARRASRMSRTEVIPQQEYLANLILAHVRRLQGQPHLSARIVSSLAKVASPCWHRWITFEQMFAGIAKRLDSKDPSVQLFWQWHDAAATGNRETFARASQQIRVELARWPALRAQFDLMMGALDLSESHDENRDWTRGARTEFPQELCGVCLLRGGAPAQDSALAYVAADPTSARRILPLGYQLAASGRILLEQGRRKQGRMETLVSVLALAGAEGVNEKKCFEYVYGFEFEPATHQSVFDVLIHRTRKYLNPAGDLRRDNNKLVLQLNTPILVADPRCTQPNSERVLQAIAAQGAGISAKEVASSAGLSLRSAQVAIKELLDAEACVVEKQSREVRYRVEDTTFSEPTVV